jgi:hypothetical protein
MIIRIVWVLRRLTRPDCIHIITDCDWVAGRALLVGLAVRLIVRLSTALPIIIGSVRINRVGRVVGCVWLISRFCRPIGLLDTWLIVSLVRERRVLRRLCPTTYACLDVVS